MGPPIAAMSIIVFTTSWNNFLLPSVFIHKVELMTLPVGLVAMNSAFGAQSLSATMAAVTMSVLPLFIVFLVAQRFIVESVTSAGIKG